MKKSLIIAIVVLFAALAACTPQADSSVTGTVTYLQRIALPDDAVVTVQIQDISRADTAATVIGEQVINAEGRQVPFAFEVAYDPSQIDSSGRYSLRATISDGAGNLLFTTDTAVMVINDGPTENVELVLAQVSE